MAFQLAAAIPGIIGVLGSLFGKKKPKETQYAANLDPVALKYRNQLLQMMGAKMGKATPAQGVGNDVLSAMYKMYFNSPYPGATTPAVPRGGGERPIGIGGGMMGAGTNNPQLEYLNQLMSRSNAE